MKTPHTACLSRVIFFGQRSLERAVSEFAHHDNSERPRQSLGNELIDEAPIPDAGAADGVRRERLGGLLSFYRRAAA